MTHYWHATDAEGTEAAVAVEMSTDKVLALWELLRSAGFAIRPVDPLEYDELNQRLEYEALTA